MTPFEIEERVAYLTAERLALAAEVERLEALAAEGRARMAEIDQALGPPEGFMPCLHPVLQLVPGADAEPACSRAIAAGLPRLQVTSVRSHLYLLSGMALVWRAGQAPHGPGLKWQRTAEGERVLMLGGGR